MDPQLLLLAAAGVAAGAVNAAVGSGTLLTYPLLLAYGLPPVVANGTNTLGISPGNVVGAWQYRSELAGRRRQLVRLAVVVGAGALAGSLLVLVLPSSVFEAVVPFLILGACALVLLQPRLTRALRARHPQGTAPGETSEEHRGLVPATAAVGVYGGYFGASQGIMLIAALTTFYDADLQRSNAAKQILQGVANGVAAVVFVVAGAVSWPPALALGIGAAVGGYVGAPVARRLPDPVLRGLVVVVGVVAAVVSLRKL